MKIIPPTFFYKTSKIRGITFFVCFPALLKVGTLHAKMSDLCNVHVYILMRHVAIVVARLRINAAIFKVAIPTAMILLVALVPCFQFIN